MKKVVLGVMFLLTGLQIFGASDSNLTGQDIMKQVDKRNDGDTQISNLKMILINKADEQRIRKVKSKRKDYGQDSKMLMTFVEPADVKGTGYLAWEFDNPEKDDSRWLYMPALRKIRRISGSSNADYFMGTDFTYDDMGDRNVNEDNHKLLGEDNINGQICWQIESIPKDKDDEYTKRVLWVRQDIDMVVKVKYFNEYGLLKTLKVSDIEKINGIWVAQKMVMDNKQDEHKTELYFQNVKIDIPIPDNLFRPTTLKRGSIRY